MDANSSAKLRDAAKVAYVRSSIQVSITPCTDVAWSLQLFQARLAKTKKLKGRATHFHLKPKGMLIWGSQAKKPST